MSTLIVSSVGRCRRLVILALLIGSTAFAVPLAAAEIMITSGSLDMRPSAGTVILQADTSIDFRVIKKVMISSAQAGYSNISFAVNRRAGAGGGGAAH